MHHEHLTPILCRERFRFTTHTTKWRTRKLNSPPAMTSHSDEYRWRRAHGHKTLTPMWVFRWFVCFSASALGISAGSDCKRMLDRLIRFPFKKRDLSAVHLTGSLPLAPPPQGQRPKTKDPVTRCNFPSFPATCNATPLRYKLLKNFISCAQRCTKSCSRYCTV